VRRISILSLCLLIYFIPFANTNFQIKPEPAADINWINIWISFFVGVFFTKLFGYLNKNSKSTDQRGDAGLPLGGWVVFLGITLMIRFILQGYIFWNENYFQMSTWNRLEHVGGLKVQVLYVSEMVLSLMSMAGLGALLYWFFGRRDIFPSMFIYYVCFFLVAQFLFLIIYHAISLPVNMRAVKENSISQFYRMSIYAVIWISFILRSRKVKQTFVYPYN
jgi:hypothetical protein